MAEWKRILISGSDGSFTNITASNLPTAGQAQVLGIDGSGNITKFNTSSIATANAVTYTGTGGQADKLAVWNSATTLTTASNHTVVGGNITIGSAEDTDYSDGLFTDFAAQTTPIGTAIDRFNEVLKGLAPPPAPNLDNIEVISGQGTNSLKLSFGGSVTTSSYTNCAGTGSTLTAVGFSSSFNQINGSTENGTSFVRLGTYTASAQLTVLLNDDVVPNGSPFVNYNSRSFSVPSGGNEAYVLEVNGTRYTESTVGSSALDGTYFKLTAARTGSFPTTGQSFDIFYHRTGSVIIPSGLGALRSGWNHAKVFQTQSNGTTTTTTYIDWIVDPAAASGQFPITFTTPSSASLNVGNTKWLSGVPYYSGSTATPTNYVFSTTASNYYKNVYNASNIAASGGTTTVNGFSSITSGVTATLVTMIDPAVATGADSLLRVSSTHTLGSTRLLSQSAASTLNLNNGLGKNATVLLTTGRWLYDSVSTANTDGGTGDEQFCFENFRIPSASYDTAASTNVGFASGSSLGTGDLLVYNGSVRYPTQGLNGGNFGLTIEHAPALRPNYSALTGDRFYFRKFTNQQDSTDYAQWTIAINGTGTVVSHGTSLGSSNFHVGVKVPGATGYRDPATAAPGAGTYTALNDGVGCGTGTLISSLNGTATVSLVSERWQRSSLTNNVMIIRLRASDAWTGNVSRITLSSPS